jgi:hypothetical protein
MNDMERYKTACNYPGIVDPISVESHLVDYLKSLGITRKVKQLRAPWIQEIELRELVSEVAGKIAKDDFTMAASDARAAMAARAASDAMAARAASDASAASAAMMRSASNIKVYYLSNLETGACFVVATIIGIYLGIQQLISVQNK